MFSLQTKQDLKAGNPKAYKEVFRLLYPRLKGYGKLFIPEDSLVDDIIQESFITFWEKRKSLKTEKSVESLLFVMVRNKCLNVLKSKKIQEEQIDIDNIPVTELQFLYQLDFTEKEQKSLEEMLIESFQDAVNELPEKMKKVFILAKMEGKKQSEIARELNISLKMVEKHISKAKTQIRKKLLRQYPTLMLLITLLIN